MMKHKHLHSAIIIYCNILTYLFIIVVLMILIVRVQGSGEVGK